MHLPSPRSMRVFISRYWPLILILILALTLRLYRIHYPLLDWHSWRQADTASVTREYLKHGIDLLHPRYHDLSSIPSGLDNHQEGYRMVEFPVVNALTALILKSFPEDWLVPVGRLVSIGFSLGTLVLLFALVNQVSGRKVAYWTALTFAVLPYAVYYSRVILPEPALLFFTTLSLYSFLRWLQTEDWRWWGLAGVGLGFGLLLKPFAAFLGLVYLGMWLGQRGFDYRVLPSMIILAVLAFLPLAGWRTWISQFPEGIPASELLYNSDGIRFQPAWFRWLFWERLGLLMLGGIGLIFVVSGIFSLLTNFVRSFGQLKKSLLVKVFSKQFLQTNQSLLIYGPWWISLVIYLAVFATGNVRHDYYQIILIPIVCITVALGIVKLLALAESLTNRLPGFTAWSSFIPKIVVGLIYLSMIAIGWYKTHGFFNINFWERYHVGQLADQVLPPDAKVIAPQLGDTSLLFQTNRTGWPIGFDIEDKINKGATHYVTVNLDDEALYLAEQYFIIQQTDEYLILDLTKPAN